MKNPYKTYKMKLTTLSPIFIGSGESILNIESEKDFKEKILQNNKERIDAWIDYFLNFNDYKIKRDKRIPREAKSPSLSGFLRFIDDKSYNSNLKKTQFILTADGAYIPGSSIKGAIRTALISDYMIENNKNLSEANEYIKNQMRGMSISDSEVIEYTDDNFAYYEIIPQKIIDNKNKGYSSTKFSQKFEFFKANKQINFKITIDRTFCTYDITQIMNILKKHYECVYNYASKNLENTNVKVSLDLKLYPNINIGGQSGFDTKNILRAEAKNNERLYIEKKKEQLSKNFRKHNHISCSKAPRYLKVVNISDKDMPKQYLTIGWCNLSVEKEIDVSDITN